MKKKVCFSGLDLIRLPMSFMVLLFHYSIIFPGSSPGEKNPIMSICYQYGFLSVEIFFAISGFLIYVHYSENLRSKGGGGNKFLSFLLGRVLRIYPLMIFTVICTAVCLWIQLILYPNGQLVMAGWATDALHTTLIAFVLSILGLQCGWISDADYVAVYGASWYLSVLMICYIFFYVILKFCKKDKIKENIFFSLVIILGAYITMHNIDFPLLYSWAGRGYTNFFIGCLVAQIIPIANTDKKRKKIVIVAICAILLYGFFAFIHQLGNLLVATAFVLSPGLLLLLTNSKLISRISNNKVVSYSGKLSFGVYLWHLPVIIYGYLFQDVFSVMNIDYSKSYVLCIFMLLVISISVITYEWLEKPVTTLCKNWMASYLN